jgi:hypothetical protein
MQIMGVPAGNELAGRRIAAGLAATKNMSRPEVDPWIWIMIGDVPPAYLPRTDCGSPAAAFGTYFHGMSKWVELARKGKSGTPQHGLPPVNLPTTPEWAEKVNQKLRGLTLTIKPLFTGENGEADPNLLQ